MKGIYAVFFELKQAEKIKIGALGQIKFEEGTYVYVGSAMNSLESRIKRHFSKKDNLHWHVDYFSDEAEPIYWLAFPLESKYECILASCCESEAEPVNNFGSSDCNCNSHLFRI